MKTKKLSLVFAMVFSLFLVSNSLFAQNGSSADARESYYESVFENFDINQFTTDLEIETFDPELVTIARYESNQDAADLVVLAAAMLVFGGGLGFTDDDTLWCLHAAYYYRLGAYVNSALFGTLGIAYTGLSADNYTQSFIDFQFKLLMFSAITQSKEVFLIYGALLAYGLGNTEFSDSFKNKYSQITAGLVMGLYIVLTTQMALMLQTNVLAYISQKDKDSDVKNDFTQVLINKNNIFLISLAINLGNRRRAMPQ